MEMCHDKKSFFDYLQDLPADQASWNRRSSASCQYIGTSLAGGAKGFERYADGSTTHFS
jgi:hypothetical protein